MGNALAAVLNGIFYAMVGVAIFALLPFPLYGLGTNRWPELFRLPHA